MRCDHCGEYHPVVKANGQEASLKWDYTDMVKVRLHGMVYHIFRDCLAAFLLANNASIVEDESGQTH